MNSVCILGLGYIGLPTASMFAAAGKNVVGVDVNPHVVESLRAGELHFHENGLAPLFASALKSGRLVIESEPRPSDVFILAVPTPCEDDHRPDLSYVYTAARSIVPHLRPGNLVVLESTSPPGTTNALSEILAESGLTPGRDFLVAYSPERVLPGRLLVELVENDRVIGGHTPAAAAQGAELYRAFVTGEIHETDATTAEMVKLMENTFRDVNIALANEFSHVAEQVGIDVFEAIRIANRHPRVSILKPGPGVGGHCIAVDPWFIVHAAPDVTPLITTARTVNDAQPSHVAELIESVMADVSSPVIALLGMAYKADTDDLRESPSLRVAQILADRGYSTRLHDAHASSLPNGSALDPDLANVLNGADAIVILTDHAVYRDLLPSDPALSGMRNRVVMDTRGCLRPTVWQAAGFRFHRLGSPVEPVPVSGSRG